MRRLLLDLGRLRTQWMGGHGEWLNHGAGLLVAQLRSNNLDVDFWGLKWTHSWAQFRSIVEDGDYDLVMMGAMSFDWPEAKRALKIVKSVNPDTETALGGFHTTCAPNEVRAYAYANHIIYGPGELAILDLARAGVEYPYEVHGTPPASLDDLPFIDRSIYPSPLDAAVGWPMPEPYLSIMTSRQCPWNCGFCQPMEHSHFGRVVQRRSVENVLEEIEWNVRLYNPPAIIFHDPMFVMQPRWLDEFLEKYASRFRIPFWASSRVDFLEKHPHYFKALQDAGLAMLSLGLEIGYQRGLDWLGKGTTIEQNLWAIDVANSLGIPLLANCIFAIPDETPEEALATVAMVKRIKVGVPSPAYYAPYPGTRLGDRLTAEGVSLLTEAEYHRTPFYPKVKGVDYPFYDKLLADEFGMHRPAVPHDA